MTDTYIHGIVINPSKNEVRLVRSAPQDVIGLVGLAPEADDSFPPEVPIVVFKKEEALRKVYKLGALGARGSLYDAVQGIYAQTDATIVMVRSRSESTQDLSNALEKLLDAESSLGYKPKIICLPGFGNELTEGETLRIEPASIGPEAMPKPTRSLKGS